MPQASPPFPGAMVNEAALDDVATRRRIGARLLKRDAFSSNRHLALGYCWSMMFSENRYPLFGIMFYFIET
jgi:hypothetical protein